MNPVRECSKCGAVHNRKHPYCGACHADCRGATELRRCSVCGVKHTRKHAWCVDCMRGYANGEYEGRRYSTKPTRIGAPPPPPPGFSERDLHIGRPLL